MKSMTGYGRGEASQNGFKATVEASSVNRKQSEISIYLPRELEALEPQLRDLINRQIARGRVVVKVTLHAGGGKAGAGFQVNAALAKSYVAQLRDLARQLQISEDITLDLLVRQPGILQSEIEIADAEHFWPAIERASQHALKELIRMREREGAHLLDDLHVRVLTMRKLAARIHKQAPLMVKRYQQQLRERVKNAGLDLPDIGDERLLKEVVYFADRSDISEELTRLESHFHQFAEYVKSKEPVGRTLDFLAQEINREVNTIGSKAADGDISRDVVRLKAELEKFREQVQNVE